MMKRLWIVLLAVLLLGCGANETAVFVDPNAVQAHGYGELYFEADGVRFGIFDEAEAVLNALPAPRATFTGETCAFDSRDEFYYFSGFELMTNEIDGTARVTAITLADDTVKTPQGLYIGMPMEDATAAFPALSQNGWQLTDGTAQLSVVITDGAVASIIYTPAE